MPIDVKLQPSVLDKLLEHYRNAKQRQGIDPYWNPTPPAEPEDVTPPPPSWFQPDPLIVGSTEQARNVKQIVDLDPLVKARLRQITFGPTAASIRDMTRSGLEPDSFQNTTLLGVTPLNEVKKNIGINPGLDEPRDYMGVVAHELGHVAGWGEHGATHAEEIVDPKGQEYNAREKDLMNALLAKVKQAGGEFK